MNALICNEIIDEELSQPSELGFDELPKPEEINAFLDDYIIGQEQAKRILSSSCLQPLQTCSGG